MIIIIVRRDARSPLDGSDAAAMLETKPVVIPASHAQFEKIREALRDGVDDVDFYRGLVDIKEAVARYMKGYVPLRMAS